MRRRTRLGTKASVCIYSHFPLLILSCEVNTQQIITSALSWELFRHFHLLIIVRKNAWCISRDRVHSGLRVQSTVTDVGLGLSASGLCGPFSQQVYQHWLFNRVHLLANNTLAAGRVTFPRSGHVLLWTDEWFTQLQGTSARTIWKGNERF